MPRAAAELGMELDFGVRRAPAEARQAAVLAFAERKCSWRRSGSAGSARRGPAGARAHQRLREVGQRRVAVVEQRLRVELDLARSACRSRGRRHLVSTANLRWLGLERRRGRRPARARKRSSETPLGPSWWRKPASMSPFQKCSPSPSRVARSKTISRVRRALRRAASTTGLAQLNQRLRLRAHLETDGAALRSRKALATGSTMSASSAVGFMNRSAWT